MPESSPEDLLAARQFTAKVLADDILVDEEGPTTMYVPADQFSDRSDESAILSIFKIPEGYMVSCTSATDEEVKNTQAKGWLALLSSKGQITAVSRIETTEDLGKPITKTPEDTADQKRRLLIKDDGQAGELIIALRHMRYSAQIIKASRPSKPRWRNA